MSEVRLIIRDAQRDIYADRHGSFADSVMAALSAEPETIQELEVALERFIAPDEWSFFHGFHSGVNDEPWDAGLVVVDLAARLVVCDSTYCMATSAGCVSYHDGRCATDVDVHFHLSEDWKLMNGAIDWEATADSRRRERLAEPPLDARGVLYGEPLLEFIARECFEAFRDRPVVAEQKFTDPVYQEEYDLVRQIHVRWLMTPRDDLRGRTPRKIMAARREFVSWSLQDREFQWSAMQQCPRPLDPDSAAYRFGGFGVHEAVVYYDLVRHLLWACREDVAQRLPEKDAGAVTAGDFVAGELSTLAKQRDQWLDEPDAEFDGRAPGSIIRNERLRIPEVISSHEAMIEDDCPLCELRADLPGPGFWHLDGCNMDDDFAFSTLHDTYEEWEAEQRKHEEFSRRFAEEEAERERLGLKYPDEDADGTWGAGFSAGESRHQGPYMRLFNVGSCLCGIIVSLRKPAGYQDAVGSSATAEPAETSAHRDLIDRLNRAYGNLREIVQSSDESRADALIEPVIEHFRDTLANVAETRPDVEPQCTELQHRLRGFLDSPEERYGEPDSSDDDEMPF